MSNDFVVGKTFRCRISITDKLTNSLTDPANLTAIFQTPSGTTAYVYDTDPELIREGEGNYYVDYTWGEAGQHKWGGRISAGSGTPGDVEAKTVNVAADPFS